MYVVKKGQELAWAVAIGVAFVVFDEIRTVDRDAIADLGTWLSGIGFGAARVVGAVVLNKLREWGFTATEPLAADFDTTDGDEDEPPF